MRIGAFEFRPALLPTIATAVMMALTFSLGLWQEGRAREKQALQDQYERGATRAPLRLTGSIADVEGIRYRVVVLEGTFLPEQQIFVDNRVHNGQAGFYVVAPLRIESTQDLVLINRGWIARDTHYPRPPKVPLPATRAAVEGLVSIPSARYFELSADTVSGQVWQNLTLGKYQARTGLKVLPFVVAQSKDLAPGLAPVEMRAEFGVDRHKGYAFQWFALCATLLVVYAVVNSKRAH